MREKTCDAVVIGHLCLDIIPSFRKKNVSLDGIMVPGKLNEVGGAVFATGGAACNVGLPLHKLGLATRIVGKIGNDALGSVVVGIINAVGDGLAGDLVVDPADTTSYTIVINPPGVDRIFLHSPGANDSFRAADVLPDALAGARHMHFGYPPLMRGFYGDGGAELLALLRRAREAGCATSLDMALPDPDGDAGRVDWTGHMRRTLPEVDFFLPSIDETVFMLDPARYAGLAAGGGAAEFGEMGGYADALLGMGPAVVGFKLGDRGFYLKASGDARRLEAVPLFSPEMAGAWRGVELYSPCRSVEVAGTTGAGDCTIAGFLAAALRGLGPEESVAVAVAAGGAGVESPGASDGVPSWEELRERMAGVWPFRKCENPGPDWRLADGGVYGSSKV